jgi:hypothetical protein
MSEPWRLQRLLSAGPRKKSTDLIASCKGLRLNPGISNGFSNVSLLLIGATSSLVLLPRAEPAGGAEGYKGSNADRTSRKSHDTDQEA